MNPHRPLLGRRRFARHVAAAVLAQFLPSRAASQAPVKQPFVDPEIAAALAQFPTFDLDAPMVKRFRLIPPSQALPPPAAAVFDLTVTRTGSPELPLAIVRPNGLDRRAPVLLHFHGGGFLFGHHRGNLPALQDLADKVRCVIVSVGYRLAPENPFPAALDDALAAYSWLIASASELDIDPDNIVVGGESAGAGLAAMLAIAIRDRGLPPPRAQLLIYPMLDDRTDTSAELPGGTPVWNAASNRFAWTAFLGGPAGAARVPDGAVPARNRNLRKLPTAFIGVGDLDLFLGENMLFARRLRQADTTVQFVRVPGACHGFDLIAPNAKVSRGFGVQVAQFLTAAMGRVATNGSILLGPAATPRSVQNVD